VPFFLHHHHHDRRCCYFVYYNMYSGDLERKRKREGKSSIYFIHFNTKKINFVCERINIESEDENEIESLKCDDEK
jgi:hypothetical protein